MKASISIHPEKPYRQRILCSTLRAGSLLPYDPHKLNIGLQSTKINNCQ